MHRSDLDSWVEARRRGERLPEPNIVLLPQDPFDNSRNANLPFRSTTYEAKYVSTTPFALGAVYLQDPTARPTIHSSAANASIDEMNLPVMYSVGYRAHLKQARETSTVGVSLPSGPPDFDGSTATSPEAVAQHVRGLAKAYCTTLDDPTPFDMYRHIIRDTANEFAVLSVNANTAGSQDALNVGEASTTAGEGEEGSRYSTAASGEALDNSSGEDDSEYSGDAVDPQWVPAPLTAKAFTLSMGLVALPQQSTEATIKVLRRHAQTNLDAARVVQGDVVQGLLSFCESFVSDEGKPVTAKCQLLSLAGTLVTARGHICEVLSYLGILEAFHKESSQIVPYRVPSALDIAKHLSFHAKELCAVTSPLHCHQEEAGVLDVVLPEGATVQCFCVSPDGRWLAVATLQAIAVYDRHTGALLAEQALHHWTATPDQAQPRSPGASAMVSVPIIPASPAATTGAFAEDEAAQSSIGVEAVGEERGEAVTLGHMTFTKDSAFIVATHTGWLRRWVLTPDLSFREEHTHEAVALPYEYEEGEIRTRRLPLLPSGCTTRALLNTQAGAHLFRSQDKLSTEPTEELILCAHVGADFYGTVTAIGTDAEELGVKLSDRTLLLSFGDATCIGNVPTEAPWLFLQVRWTRGVWTLKVNDRLIELRGQRNVQNKTVTVKSVTCFKGFGHVASFSLWTDCGDSATAVSTYARERRVEPAVKALVNLPLDEGMGVWVKDTVSGSCVTLSETQFVWDDALHPPFSSSTPRKPSLKKGQLHRARGANRAESSPRDTTPAFADDDDALLATSVRLDGKCIMGSQVLMSVFHTYIIMPAATKGSDDMVAKVDRATNTIVDVYRCPRASTENLYALRRDESELFLFQPRFGTFTWSRLFTTSALAHELDKERGIDGASIEGATAVTPRAHQPDEGTVPWLLEAIYQRLYLESADLHRIPPESSPLSLANLRCLAQQLSYTSSGTNRVRVIALLSLLLSHFHKLDHVYEKELSQIASSLKTSCAKAITAFPDSAIIRRTATTLLQAATRKSLTLEDKAAALLDKDPARIASVLRDCTTKESFHAVIQHIAVHKAHKLVTLAEQLLQICRAEQSSSASTAVPGSTNEASHNRPVGAVSGVDQRNGHSTATNAGVWQPGMDNGSLSAHAPTITHLMTWFVLSSVTVLRSYGRLDVIGRLVEVLAAFMQSALLENGESSVVPPPPPQCTAVHTGCLPLFTIVADLCPTALSPSVESTLLRVLSETSGGRGCVYEHADDVNKRQKTPIAFSTREACDVYPVEQNSGAHAWRLSLDFSRAVSVSVHKEANTAPLSILCSDNDQRTGPTLHTMTTERPFVKMAGGSLIFYGNAESTFTVVAQYELVVDASWTSLVREALQHVLIAHAAQLTNRVRPSEVYIPPFMRHGLNTQTLRKHGVDLPGREQPSRLANAVLADSGSAKEFVDQVMRDMRGSIVPSMRPAIQALLSILVHSGSAMHQAEDELKLRWFSREWGSQLQGPNRDVARTFLQDLATWVTSSLHHQPEVGATGNGNAMTPTAGASTSVYRHSTAERRRDLSSSMSHSISDRRGSTTSSRKSMKLGHQGDTLDQVRTLLSKEVTAEQLEGVLVERVRTAVAMARGLTLLLRVLKAEGTAEGSAGPVVVPERTLLAVLDVLWNFAQADAGTHFLNSLNGAGIDLESNVRRSFHRVLRYCDSLLLGPCPKTLTPLAVLSGTATAGRATMMLLAIRCHPWDGTDCESFITPSEGEQNLLQRLEAKMNVPTGSLTLTSPWRLRREKGETMSPSEEQSLRAELLGAADINSLSRIYPNDFSVVIPEVETSRSESGIIIEKFDSSALVLRADEGWPLAWRDGVPRVFYFEATVKSRIANVEIGLIASHHQGAAQIRELNYFYGAAGDTHKDKLPSFSTDDVVGCGIVATTRSFFFTLNGKFISFFKPLSDKYDIVFPALHLDERPSTKLLVNFGTAPFAFDFRQLHPSLCLRTGPTWYRVASTAQMTLHYLTTRACTMEEVRRPSANVVLSHHCEVVCRNVNKVTSSLMHLCMEGNPVTHDSGTRIKQAVIFAVAEYSLMILIATMRHIVRGGATSWPLPDVIGEMIFDAASVLMLLPLHAIQVTTIGVLPEIIPHVVHTVEGTAPVSLVRTLFENANGATASEAKEVVPFIPMWRECDGRCMSIASAQVATMRPEAQRSIVLGNRLPRQGTVSFTVKIQRRSLSKGHSLRGGYFIGVAVVGLSPLSPTSNSQSWKAVKPPIVWAIHDTSPQLPHATNPTVKPNCFQRTFGHDDAIRVVLDRESRTLDFYRDDEHLKTLFSGIPSDVELVPFVQLYNDDALAEIYPGEMTAPITSATLLSAASVDVLRAMLTLEPFQRLVGKGIAQELDTCENPKVCLALFHTVPDPRQLQLQSAGANDRTFVSVRRINDLRCKITLGGESSYEHLHNLRLPATAKIACSFEGVSPEVPFEGLQICAGKIFENLRRRVLPLVTLHALCCLEEEKRQSLIEEENDRWDFLFHGIRVSGYVNIQRLSATVQLAAAPRMPVDFTFSADLSHPNFSISPHYCGKLATVPNASKVGTPPFIAIAEPSVPSQGKFSIRCQFIRGHNGQILGGGYYFGVCTPAFNWKRRDLNSAVPDVWAFHDMDDAPWRLRHMHPAAVFPTAAEPHCIVVSGDTIRLEVDRDAGTMHVYRKPMNAEEISLGLIFTNIPRDVKLYPFVHLFNVDAVAVLLPTNSADPPVRLTVQQPHFALWPTDARRDCDGCIAAHTDTKLTHRWYKCNECVDYALCKSCFDLCVHSHHAFTEMGVPYYTHSTTAPLRARKGMKVVVPGIPCVYLRSSGCHMHVDQMNCVAEAIEDNGFAIWGMVHARAGQFTVRVDTTDGEPLSSEHPMLIGVGPAEEVMQLSREKLRSKCFSQSTSIVALCSDSALRRKMECESRFPHGFARGSTITVDVDIGRRTVSFIRDWIVVGTRSIEFPSTASTMQYPLCCFVLFGRKNVKVSIVPERASTILATVEGQTNHLLKVSSVSDARVRYVPLDGCRVPLRPAVRGSVEVGRLGYTYVNKKLVQCRVAGVEKETLCVTHLQESGDSAIPISHFLMEPDDVLGEERLVHREATSQGPSVESGFVISRLLMILCSFCESPVLSSLVVRHYGDLARMLRSLSSVHIGNETPLDFLHEIRSFVTATVGCLRGPRDGARCLKPFVPTLIVDDRKRRFKPGMLVQEIAKHTANTTAVVVDAAGNDSPGSEGGGPAHVKDERAGAPVYRVRSRRGDTLFLDDISTGARHEASFKNCIPLKQSGEVPWYTLDNGLPCSLLEHTMRVMHPQSPPKNQSIDGMWEGELSFERCPSLTVELGLTTAELNAFMFTEAVPGTAAVKNRDPLMMPQPPLGTASYAVLRTESAEARFLCFFEHARYSRTVNMTLVPAGNAGLVGGAQALRREGHCNAAERIVSFCRQTGLRSGEDAFYATLEVDAEGLRMSGPCGNSEGRIGTLSVNWSTRLSFAPLTTDKMLIEPLPDCVDTVIPGAMQRDVCDTMHRLIVLLARHLYLVICNNLQSVSKGFVEHIFLFHTHPLTKHLASQLVGPPHSYFMVSEACHLILDPSMRPWDAATLASLVTETLLLRPDALRDAPESLVWDTLHAVVVAAHRSGSHHRKHILRSITTFLGRGEFTSPSAHTQLFSTLASFVNRNALAPTDVLEPRSDVCAGVDLLLSAGGGVASSVPKIPITALRCLTDIWQSLRSEQPLPGAVDAAGHVRHGHEDVAVVVAKGVFGDFRDDELRVGKVVSSHHTDLSGRFYYEVVLPERVTAPFAVGWGTDAHMEVPSQHVGSDAASFAFNGSDVTSRSFREEYKGTGDIVSGNVVGCLLDMNTRTAAWSVDGIVGAFIPIPIALAPGTTLAAYASIGTCPGMQVRLRAHQFEYVPDGYTDLSFRYARVVMEDYDAAVRSTLPPQSVNFYTQLASYMSDLEENAEAMAAPSSPQQQQQHQQSARSQADASSAQGSAVTVGERSVSSPTSGARWGSRSGAPISAGARVSRSTAPTGEAATHDPLMGGEAGAVSGPEVDRAAPATPVTPVSPGGVHGRARHGRGNGSVASLSLLATAAVSLGQANSTVTAEDLYLQKYHCLASMPRAELEAHTRVIRVVESCMATANRFVDLDGDAIEGSLSSAFVFLKPLVRRSFRRRLLVAIPAVEKVTNASTIAIRITELHSTLPRTPEVALQHSVLSQLYKQIGSITDAQWGLSPLFRVNLYISGSGHAPIDMGGPYRQVWTFLAEEIMRHPDKCYPHSDFHRNPLFSFVNNSQRVSLVPDYQADSAYDITLFNFFGKIMGHAARTQLPLDIDFSPFLWKFLVDDPLTIKDYFQHVDSVVETSMGDDNFLLSMIAEDIIPGFAMELVAAEDPTEVDADDAVIAQRRREIGERCLVHSMDQQLGAIRRGLWSVLPRRVVRCLSWRDLEKLVCGETNPSVEDLKRYIRTNLSATRDKFFWQIVETLSAEEKASLLCFASGQRRLPLIRVITVQENKESLDHLPRAQSCSSLITIPAYTSYDVFREKLLIALQHQAEMELA